MPLKSQLNRLAIEEDEAAATERFRQQLWERMYFWSLDNIEHHQSAAAARAMSAVKSFDQQFNTDPRSK